MLVDVPDTVRAVLEGRGTAALLPGDAAEALKGLPDSSVDAVICDPPAGIGFMQREWDRFGGTGRGRDPRGAFVASMARILAQARRALKPGGHALVWAMPRTSHWAAWACEEAGFEVRDVVHHAFGSGFPKSLDASKAIDRMRGDREKVLAVTAWVKRARDAAGVTNAQIDAHFGLTGMAGHWTTQGEQPQVPTAEHWPRLLALLGVEGPPPEVQVVVDEVLASRGQPGPNWFRRPVTGEHERPAAAQVWRANKLGEEAGGPGERRDLPATEEAARWLGWGTALKPGHEHWILCRKPFKGTVADCLLANGVGALNVDACRVPLLGGERLPGYGPKGSDPANRRGVVGKALDPSGGDAERMASEQRASIERTNRLGRWPSNFVLSHGAGCERRGTKRVEGSKGTRGSPESAGEPQGLFQIPATGEDVGYVDADGTEEVEDWACEPGCPVAELDEQGEGASRYYPTHAYGRSDVESFEEGAPWPPFSYVPKPSASEKNAGLEGLPKREVHRYGAGIGEGKSPEAPAVEENHHPTVKPVALMRWLVRLVTPPGGVVLDPFMGSGTTGIAAAHEGARFVGVEREPDYFEVARRRVAWAIKHPPEEESVFDSLGGGE